ncbi:hypothetical protein Pst134EA_030632 [Puccinia striiformis f. sp. tritici]|uniref:hypothetical protein n=1 Tax=Puccinia striiformis f. sp. tritici TaxID=168172 RepID=UPI0020073DCF|nr:hypothetical protein Pst134EA_030632 [Puccinia striiformis f. sp. tritici]KAH9446725.1 hypothetical protein Pst134EA_030632 [Puccinia striiformis f. sp. tritici]KAI9601988.1 hypothetical protein KEM48_001278 [Puccinia striiformis f. sp. tritici PST-130]
MTDHAHEHASQQQLQPGSLDSLGNDQNRKRASVEPVESGLLNPAFDGGPEKRQRLDEIRRSSQVAGMLIDPASNEPSNQHRPFANPDRSPQLDSSMASNDPIQNHQSSLHQAPSGAEQDQQQHPSANNKDQTSKVAPNPLEQRKRLEEQAKQYLLAQTQAIIIPSYAAWFDLTKIHPLEKKSLPEFFNGRNRSKVPSIYKDYRDFIVNSYRLNPSEYLTVTACRRNLAGDVCAIMRVHAFLEQWGIINYQVDLDTRPTPVGPPFTGHFRVLLDTPRGFMPLHSGTVSRKTPASLSAPTGPTAPASATGTGSASIQPPPPPSAPSNIDLRKDLHANTTESGPPVIRCDVCGTDCSKISFHHTRVKTYDICANCYQEGRFGTHMNSAEFIKLERPSGVIPVDSKWTDQEILLLLEGLEMHSDDWEKIAQHVGGTKTKEECILQFLRMPIEDEFLRGSSSEINTNSILGLGKIPLSGAENPVLSVLSFLVGLVEPELVAEMAGKTVEKIKHDLRSKVLEIQEDSLRKSATSTQQKPDDEETRVGTEDVLRMDGGETTAEKKAVTGTEDVEGLPQNPSVSMDIDESHNPNESTTNKRTAIEIAAAAFTSASAKALVLGSEDEIELGKLMETVTNQTIKKLEIKLNQFEKLESTLEIQRRNLDLWRQNLSLERQAVVKEILEFKKLQNSTAATNNGNLNIGEINNSLDSILDHQRSDQISGLPIQAVPVQPTDSNGDLGFGEGGQGTMNIR